MKNLLPLIVVFGFSPVLYAADVYTVTADVGGEVNSAGYSTMENFVESMSNDGLRELSPSYTETSAANLVLAIRGIPADATYASNSTSLVFRIDHLDINETFTGATRDESQDLLEEWFKNQGGKDLTRLLQDMVASTPIDPVAGNPNSLMSKMVAADFAMVGAGGIVIQVSGGAAGDEEEEQKGLFGIGAQFGSYSADDYDVDTYQMPINYIKPLSSDPSKALIFDVPIAYTDTEGAATGDISFGFGYRFPLKPQWHLMPMIRLGVVGSEDLGSAAGVYSGSLSSNYKWYFDDLMVSMSNMVGIYQTETFDSGDYDIDYDLSNQVLRNGVQLSGSLNMKLFGKPTSWELDLVDTLFFGDELYIEHYDEISVTLGTRGQASGMQWNAMRLGLTYTFGDEGYDGYKLNFGYRF